MHWLAWEKLTWPKNKGAWAFVTFTFFNLAMLARHAWRLLTNLEMLCSQVLNAKYAQNGSILQCKPRDGISYYMAQYPKRHGVVKGRDHLAGGKWRCSEYLGGSMDSPWEHKEA
jgi:hypothetical protein